MASYPTHKLNPIEEFDYLIWGNEPAGLWLATRLQKKLDNLGKKARIGWLQTQPSTTPVLIPFHQAVSFGIYPQKRWSSQIRFSRSLSDWSQYPLQARYPELKDAHFLEPHRSEATLDQSSQDFFLKMLRKYPSLTDEASAIWQFMGRAEKMHPQTLLATALKCVELFWWDATNRLPDSVVRMDGHDQQKIHQIKRLKGGVFCFHMDNQRNILARQLIINMPYHQCRNLAAPLLGKGLTLPERPLGAQHIYRFNFEVKGHGLPSVLPDLTLFSESPELPRSSQIWGLAKTEKPQEYQLWATAHSDLDLEECFRRFRKGLRYLGSLFPFLSQNISNLAHPLRSEAFENPIERQKVFTQLQQGAMEKYRTTSLILETRHSNLYNLGPWYQCYQPYPLGPLHGARLLLEKLSQRPHRAKPLGPAKVQNRERPGPSV